MRILLVEDEARLAASIKKGLEEEGYRVDVAADGQRGETEARVGEYDALIVDGRLPRLSGVDLVRHLRASGYTVPILMLTALVELEHRVAGLDAGADDYLGKPFAFEELLARLRALLRRPVQLRPDDTICLGPLHYDGSRRRATLDGRALLLRQKELALLALLLRHPGRIVSRSVIAETVWEEATDVSSNVIDVTVSQLRAKLAESAPSGAGQIGIETIRGAGYRLVERLP